MSVVFCGFVDVESSGAISTSLPRLPINLFIMKFTEHELLSWVCLMAVRCRSRLSKYVQTPVHCTLRSFITVFVYFYTFSDLEFSISIMSAYRLMFVFFKIIGAAHIV